MDKIDRDIIVAIIIRCSKVNPDGNEVGRKPYQYKRWICDVRQRLAELGYAADDHARILWDAHKNGWITLSRCDLPQVRDSAKVLDSEINITNGCYHYVAIN